MRAVVSCNVAMGLDSIWTLEYEYMPDDGWLCLGVIGPLEGAYVIQGGILPDDQQQENIELTQ